ncbi:MAG: hypothetical protein COV73_05085 [Candidatus Omnitrophica bacterium CG11_big_fil_rev_8_21_14_0_20_43_6]|nr:MAG: hypothetical protein COV73_05085 [Candidatus Omnitrophica bacterium CG11_big_fil_rev_8_21_14_0_20_43_6]
MNIGLQDSFRTRFIAVESDALVIETIQTESKTRRQHLRILRFKGTWHANQQNELCFEVASRKGPPQTYTFKGTWKINNNQQIKYTLAGGHNTLLFKGHWQITSQNRLTYLLEGSSTSRFEFKVQLESPTLFPKKGQIRYRLGTGIRRSRLAKGAPIVTLYGEWKFGRNLGLIFEMDYGQGRVRAMEFGAKVTFERNNLIFTLKNELGQPLGITLTMTHKFLKSFDAEAFIRLTSRQQEQGAEAGITLPF